MMNITEVVLEIGQYKKDAKTKALKSLGATLNVIDIWLKLFLDKYDTRCKAYINDIKEMFKQILQTMIKSLTPKQKVQKLMTDIGDGWYMEKNICHKFLDFLFWSKLFDHSFRYLLEHLFHSIYIC